VPTFAYIEQNRVPAPEGSSDHNSPPIHRGSEFGFSVAVSQDGLTLLVGSPYVGADGTAAPGAAYVFTRAVIDDDWTLQETLTGTVSAYANFGYSVALSADGDTAIVGAPYDGATSSADAANPSHGPFGSAEVFVRSGGSWSLQDHLEDHNAANGPWFGMRVDLTEDGDTAAVGDWRGSSVVVYTRSGGSWNGEVVSPASGIAFGYSLDFASDDTLVIGAPGEGTNGFGWSAGSVYVAEKILGVWTITAGPLTVSESAELGNDVAASPTTLAASGFLDDDTVGGSVAVAVWRKSGGGWVFDEDITPSIAQPSYITYRLSLSDDDVLLIAGGYESLDDPGPALAIDQGVDVWSRAAVGGWDHWVFTPFLPSGGAVPGFGSYGLEITSDSRLMAVGGYQDFSGEGSAWTFLDDRTRGSATVSLTVSITTAGHAVEVVPTVSLDGIQIPLH